jgi:hypothetical protein
VEIEYSIPEICIALTRFQDKRVGFALSNRAGLSPRHRGEERCPLLRETISPRTVIIFELVYLQAHRRFRSLSLKGAKDLESELLKT